MPTLMWLSSLVVLHQVQAGVGEVVDVEELARRRPVPQISTSAVPSAFASWNLRISAGRTWLLVRSKLSFGP